MNEEAPTVTTVWSTVLRDLGVMRPTGPVHAMLPEPGWGQAWCGARVQFRHWTRPGTAGEVDCPRCRAAIRRGRPFARGSR